MTAFLRRFYAGGGASTTLASAMGISDTSFSISNATGWPGGSPGANFIVVIDRGTSSEEKILCSSNSGTVVSVASSGRGYDGTSATSHNSNATVSLCGGAIDFDETNQVSSLLGNASEGSLFYGGGTGSLARTLPIGGAGALLQSNAVDPSWLALGANGYVLTSNGTTSLWKYPTLTYVQGGSVTTGPLSNAYQQVQTLAIATAGLYLVTCVTDVYNNTANSLTQIVSVLSAVTASTTGAVSSGDLIFPNTASGTWHGGASLIVLASLSAQTYYLNVNGGTNGSQISVNNSTVSAVRIA